MKYIIIYISIFFVSVSITAQNLNRIYQSHNFKDGVFEVITNEGHYEFRLYSKEIMEVSFIPKGEAYNPSSHAVVMKPKTEPWVMDLKEDKTIIEFNTLFALRECVEDINCNNNIAVKIQKSPFRIHYFYDGKLITSEKRGYYKSKHEPMELVKGNIIADSTEKIEFNLSKDEVLYGGGARALGMNRRGYRLPLYNRAHYGYETDSKLMNYTMPIVLSSNQYMIHFDNAPIGYLDLDSKGDNTLTYETVSGRKTYQIIVGNTWYDMLNNYTKLTGKQPMLPRWALGNFSSRFGYHSQEEVEQTIAKFKEEKIPVDAIILDLYWFGKELKGTMGNLEVFRDSFPDFEGMVKRLNDKGVKTITITEPFVLTTSKKWDEAVAKNVLAKDSVGNNARYDFYFGNTGLIDIYKPEGEQWFWDIYKELANKGVAGVWGDLGEPEVHPDWVQHHTGSASEVHNIYGHDWARLIHEGYQRDFPETRPFILMRAGYSGSQRYGMVPWSGDVNRTWGGLQSQPEIALQMGMQGLAYMHSDLGGFAGANLDDELYVRWLQYGVFNPIFRPHAQEEVPSEPVFRIEKAKRLAKEAIELRYQLLPYNYNLMYENHKYGKPLMRPLFFEEPNNPELLNYSKTYLWGNDILVSPVLEAGKKEQEVYFPKDNVWFDFYTGERIKGGQMKNIQLNEYSIPTYVRAGAFIPEANLVQTTKDYNDTYYNIHYYFDTSILDSSRKIYNDDGLSYEPLENNDFEIFNFKCQLKNKYLEFKITEEVGFDFKSSGRVFYLYIHGINNKPKRVKVGKRISRFEYFEDKGIVKIAIERNPKENSLIKIKLNN